MSGVAVIVALLKASAAITAIVDANRIMAGDAPINTPKPLILVTQISSVPYNAIRINETPKVHTDRVQVTVLTGGSQGTPQGSGYPGVRALLRLVLAACPSQRGTIAGIACQNITPDVEGPDLSDEATALYSGSRDFLVRWVA